MGMGREGTATHNMATEGPDDRSGLGEFLT